MKVLQVLYMALLVVIVDHMTGCVSVNRVVEQPARQSVPSRPQAPPAPPPKIKKPKFHQQISVTIPITHFGGEATLNADIYRPNKKIEPKTLVIIVPGSGNVSRRGEVSGDGIDSYEQPIDMTASWAFALSEKGMFVLAYDKRTCNARASSMCLTNDQKDIDSDGIVALAHDLDQVYAYARDKFNADEKGARIVLMSTTQGAQTISLSTSAKEANGIVLLSPIAGDLQTMWVDGLSSAAEKAHGITKRNRLLNLRESMFAFFEQLKKGAFPETSIIRGASAKFWLSWMESSKNTFSRLLENQRPTFLLFSDADKFSGPSLAKSLERQAKASEKITIKSIAGVDRNFVDNSGVPEVAFKEVYGYIESLR